MDTFIPKGNISGPILPEFVLKLSITAGAKLMYSILCWHAYDKDYCWPSYSKLAERMSCSINTVKNYFRELVEAKLVMVVRESYRSSKYFLLKPSEKMLNDRQDLNLSKDNAFQSNSDDNPSKFGNNLSNFGYLNNPNKPVQETPTPMSSNTCIHDRGQNENSVGVGNYISDFEKVYAVYPRKEAKGLAKIAWRQLSRNGVLPELDVILAAIRRFSASHNWQRENGRFIPQLSNFLKGERWNDPITETEILDNAAKVASENARRKLQQKEEQRRTESEKRKAVHRPDFDAFASKFKGSFHFPMVFGFWMYFRDKGIAPLASDVPEDNKLGIMDFIKSFASHVRQVSQAIMPQEKDCKNTTSCSINKLESSNSFRPKHSGAIGDVESVGEILKNSPLFMGLKTDQPKLGRAIAC